MKLKYYLNGFGIGILFATVILSISFLIRSGSGAQMTDEEVMARARQLGMEMTTAASETESSTEPETPAETETASEAETTTEAPTTTEPETEVQTATTAQNGGSITIEIVSGMTSESVSQMLAERGIIGNAAELNAYIVQSGQAGRIRVGTYEMTPGISYDDIISIICR